MDGKWVGENLRNKGRENHIYNILKKTIFDKKYIKKLKITMFTTKP